MYFVVVVGRFGFWLLGFSAFQLVGFSGFLALRLLGFSACSLLGFWAFWLLVFSCFLASPSTLHALLKTSMLMVKARVATCHHHVCSSGRLCGSFCLQMEGLRPKTSRFVKASNVYVPKCHVITMGLRHPRFSRRSCLHSKPSIMCVDHFVCKWGGAAPPPTPLLFQGHPCKTRS